MSIASEITALNTNLEAAKDAVTDKGGTVGDTGLAGLASEIGSIPSGGGEPSSYGVVKYDDGGVLKTVTMATASDYYMLGSIKTNVAGNYLINNTSVDKNSIVEVEIFEGVTSIPSYFLYYDTNLEKVTLPSTIQTIGDNFCGYCSKLDCELTLTNVKDVGASFLRNCTIFNHPIIFTKVTAISSNFMQSCTAFNSNIALGNSLISIGQHFLDGCWAFAKSLTIPSSIYSPSAYIYGIGRYFMYNCKNFTGPLSCECSSSNVSVDFPEYLVTTDSSASMYTTGITLTGAYAQDWKTHLPDRDTSPYRKLIVDS